VTGVWETVLSWFQGRDRRPVAIVVTSDGRRVQMPLGERSPLDESVAAVLRSLLAGLESLLGLITGSRRENGGTRRDER
jgi:hypothetical protein